MNASRHLELFEEGARMVEGFGRERLDSYLASEYFGENDDRDELNALDDRFIEIEEAEDLLALNAAWLRGHPDLAVLTVEQMEEEARRRGLALPDRGRRAAEALANEPRYMKLIRALCDEAGHQLERVTAGDPNRVHEGAKTVAWHFLTDQGHHHMIEWGGRVIMFRGHSTTDCVCEVEAPEDE